MNKNILYIGPYRSSCSWGIAARNYIKSLILTGNNITTRPIWMSNRPEEYIDPEISALEYNSSPYYDICLQHVLPHLYEFNGNFGRNIGLSFFETSGWSNVWGKKISLMDEMIVPSELDRDRIYHKNANLPPIHIIPIPTDTSKFDKEYPKILDIEEDYFNFYYIGDIIERKNIEKLLVAFHCAFKAKDKVNLVIKTSENYKNKLLGLIDQVKSKMRIKYDVTSYKKEIVIFNRLTDDEICGIHKNCHAFVMPSSGESWSLVCVDAAGFGNVLSMTDRVGVKDQLANFVIPTQNEYVYSSDYPMIDLYTSNEEWGIPTIYDIADQMGRIFEHRGKEHIKKLTDSNRNIVKERFSYQAIANHLKEII